MNMPLFARSIGRCLIALVLLASASGAGADEREDGLAAFVNGDCREAVVHFQRVLQDTPDDTAVALQSAECDVTLGDLDLAKSLAQGVLDRDANNVDALLLLARIAGRQDNWEAARDFYASAVALAPDRPETHLGLGQALGQIGDEAGADAQFALYRQQSPAQLNVPTNNGTDAPLAEFLQLIQPPTPP